MPMHDWTKAEAGVYHDFHNVWLLAIRHALNNGVLPAGYYALSEQRMGLVKAYDLTGQSPGVESPTPLADRRPPAVQVLERGKIALRPPGRRLVVRDEDHEVVAVLEIASPRNTKDRVNFAGFVGKAADELAAGIHLVVIDPFRPPKHSPGGLHAAIWKKATRQRKGRKPFTPPADQPLLAASYCASAAKVTAAVQTFAVGEPVPDIPLYLTADEDFVTVPLEDTYQAAWPEVPKFWRDVLEA
jgi:hypothetical protein